MNIERKSFMGSGGGWGGLGSEKVPERKSYSFSFLFLRGGAVFPKWIILDYLGPICATNIFLGNLIGSAKIFAPICKVSEI